MGGQVFPEAGIKDEGDMAPAMSLFGGNVTDLRGRLDLREWLSLQMKAG